MYSKIGKKLILCVLLFSALLAEKELLAQGTSGFEILRLQTQPRGSSLAGAVIAGDGNIENIYYNPAGLATIKQKTGTAGYMNYLLDIQSGHLAYVDPTKNWGAWGVSLSYTNYGDFEAHNTSGVELPNFTATDVVLGVSYARQLRESTSLGGTLKLVQSKIEDYSGRALALDVAGQHTIIQNKLRLGVGIFNLGTTIKAYYDYKDKLPLYYRIGVWGVPEGLPAELYFSVTVYHEYLDNYSLGSLGGSALIDLLGDFYYGAGAEFHPIDMIYLRIGFDTVGLDQKIDTQKDVLAGVCFGLGLVLDILSMDYGLASHGELGLVQRVSLSKTF